MDASEIKRRLDIARLAVSYYEAQQRGEPFEVQWTDHDVPWPTTWKVGGKEPWFHPMSDWRRKPREPRRLTLHRLSNQEWTTANTTLTQLETAEFIEVLPEPDDKPKTKRFWVRERDLWLSREGAAQDCKPDEIVVEVEVRE